jgi:hypothetical protein
MRNFEGGSFGDRHFAALAIQGKPGPGQDLEIAFPRDSEVAGTIQRRA